MSARISEPGCSDTQDTNHQAHELTTHVQCSFSTYTHLHRANHSSVILLGSTSEEADLPIVVNRLTLAKHYQLSNKHVTEVSTGM